MPESWPTRLARWGFNCFPAYRGTGARIESIASDWLEVRVRLTLSWRSRNDVGTLFGGSMYGAVDSIYMVMLIKTLGPGFVVWDKAATIRFLRPGRATLRATFRLPADAPDRLREDARTRGKVEREFQVNLVDAGGQVYATCTKRLHIRWRPGTADRGA